MSVLADIATDISGTQGGAGWTYGTLLTPGSPASFTAAGMVYVPGGLYWTGPGQFGTPFVGSTFGHPYIGPGGTIDAGGAAWRWTSPVAGPATVAFAATHLETGGGGVRLRIYQGSTLRAASGVLFNAAGSTTADVTLAVGDVLTFELDANSSADSDSTGIDLIRVTAPDVSPLGQRRRAA